MYICIYGISTILKAECILAAVPRRSYLCLVCVSLTIAVAPVCVYVYVCVRVCVRVLLIATQSWSKRLPFVRCSVPHH